MSMLRSEMRGRGAKESGDGYVGSIQRLSQLMQGLPRRGKLRHRGKRRLRGRRWKRKTQSEKHWEIRHTLAHEYCGKLALGGCLHDCDNVVAIT